MSLSGSSCWRSDFHVSLISSHRTPRTTDRYCLHCVTPASWSTTLWTRTACMHGPGASCRAGGIFHRELAGDALTVVFVRKDTPRAVFMAGIMLYALTAGSDKSGQSSRSGQGASPSLPSSTSCRSVRLLMASLVVIITLRFGCGNGNGHVIMRGSCSDQISSGRIREGPMKGRRGGGPTEGAVTGGRRIEGDRGH